MHPVANIRGTASRHLEGRRIVLGVCGSIAAVKCVELARELARHGAEVVAVMTESATRILHPDALEFATGTKAITRLSGAVEHVALLGDVPGKADLLLVAPATANSIAKMALGIDDSPVTTCATVAIGTKTPILVAPAMHEAMLDHPVVAQHVATLRRLGIHWVEPDREEKKAKLADVEAIVEAAIHLLANKGRRPGPLAGQRALVISGATAEDVDAVRILTNRSSGQSGILIATELRRLGAEVELWQGHATAAVPAHLEPFTQPYRTHADLMQRARKLKGPYAQVWMPAAIGDYAAPAAAGKIPSGLAEVTLELSPLPKVIEVVRRRLPKSVLVAFKAESDASRLIPQARQRLEQHGAQFVVANLAASFASPTTEAVLVSPAGERVFAGPKAQVLAQVVAAVAAAAAAGGAPGAAAKPAHRVAKAARGKPPRRKAPAKPRTKPA